MERNKAHICLTLADREPEHGVYTLTTAAKILSELQAGRQDKDIAVIWKLVPSDGGNDQRIVLCGSVEYRSRWQVEAYLDYIQSRICDMIDDKKVVFRLTLGSCQKNGG